MHQRMATWAEQSELLEGVIASTREQNDVVSLQDTLDLLFARALTRPRRWPRCAGAARCSSPARRATCRGGATGSPASGVARDEAGRRLGRPSARWRSRVSGESATVLGRRPARISSGARSSYRLTSSPSFWRCSARCRPAMPAPTIAMVGILVLLVLLTWSVRASRRGPPGARRPRQRRRRGSGSRRRRPLARRPHFRGPHRCAERACRPRVRP